MKKSKNLPQKNIRIEKPSEKTDEEIEKRLEKNDPVIGEFFDMEIHFRVLRNSTGNIFEDVICEKDEAQRNRKISYFNSLVYKYFEKDKILWERQEDVLDAYAKGLEHAFSMEEIEGKKQFEVRNALMYFSKIKEDALEYVRMLIHEKALDKKESGTLLSSRVYAREIMRKDIHLSIASSFMMGLVSLENVENDLKNKNKEICEEVKQDVFSLLYKLGMSKNIKTPEDISQILKDEYQKYKKLFFKEEQEDVLRKIKGEELMEKKKFNENDISSVFEAIHNIALPLAYRATHGKNIEDMVFGRW